MLARWKNFVTLTLHVLFVLSASSA